MDSSLLSGDDNGPRDTVWEIGDVMPGHDRNARTELIIENILQGTGVRERFGCDLAFILQPHIVRGGLAMQSIPPFDPAKPCPCGLHGKSYGDCCKDKGIHALGNEMLRGTFPKTVPGALTQIQSSMVNDLNHVRDRYRLSGARDLKQLLISRVEIRHKKPSKMRR